MMGLTKTSACSVVLLLVVAIDTGFSNPLKSKESWGYVDVREGAHMFWWLYYADSPSASYSQLPLVMWLQGGPGGSGCGFGNFEEIGPLDRDLEPRKNSWVQYSSVLFVDNPVGTGFSYTDSDEAFATDVATVASDMLVLLKQFFNKEEEFQVGSASHWSDHQGWVQLHTGRITRGGFSFPGVGSAPHGSDHQGWVQLHTGRITRVGSASHWSDHQGWVQLHTGRITRGGFSFTRVGSPGLNPVLNSPLVIRPV
ncbi:retinoid-inducible serine carboxypeptidase-like [Oncorhynchus masou masou]|uniref:retinoid-inducible serine carboxypeptidase-like n=1 Tax=Oncorhynchus masou masou TaxID=90313 RepID=UPI0031831292